MKNILLVVISSFFCFALKTYGQNHNLKISDTLSCKCDTLYLYSSKASEKIAKWRYDKGELYYPTHILPSIPPHTEIPKSTNQDSLYYKCRKEGLIKYVILFDDKNRKVLEGATGGWLFRGEIKEYYRKGQLKQIRIYETLYKDGQSLCDGPCPVGVWKYYRKNGSLIKTEDINPYTNEFVTEFYNSKGTKKKKKKHSTKN